MILAICDTSGMTKVFLILKIGLKIIFVLVPIIIIIATIINLVKIITSGKEDDLKAKRPCFRSPQFRRVCCITFPSLLIIQALVCADSFNCSPIAPASPD